MSKDIFRKPLRLYSSAKIQDTTGCRVGLDAIHVAKDFFNKTIV